MWANADWVRLWFKRRSIVPLDVAQGQTLLRLYRSNEAAGWAAEVDYAQSQLHSPRAPADSVWSTCYKTEWMVLGCWGSVNLGHLFTRPPLKFGCVRNEKGEVDLLQPWSDLTLIHWIGNSIFYRGDPNPRLQFGVRGLLKAHTRKTSRLKWGSNLQSLDCRSKLLPTELS